MSPTAKGLSIADKREVISPDNFPAKGNITKCVCGENKDNMEHGACVYT